MRGIMTADETRAYMRNLAIVARADDVVTALEDTLVHEFLRRYDFDEETWKEILKEALVAKNPRIDLRPLGRLSLRVRCLEDMLELSMCDGIADKEKAVLSQAAREVGITHQQVSQLMQEARARCDARER